MPLHSHKTREGDGCLSKKRDTFSINAPPRGLFLWCLFIGAIGLANSLSATSPSLCAVQYASAMPRGDVLTVDPFVNTNYLVAAAQHASPRTIENSDRNNFKSHKPNVVFRDASTAGDANDWSVGSTWQASPRELPTAA